MKKVKGKPKIGEFDKSFYSDDHDVPALYIGGQVVALGDGEPMDLEDNGKEDHLRWKLDEDKEHVVEIREVDDNE